MEPASEKNKRIAKNTMMLYIRMLLVMAVTLYTSRVMLNVLGVDDYGIYNIVASVVIAFSFISGPLGTATQRFLSFELGRNNIERQNMVFSMSLIIYTILAFVLFIIVESAGIWFIYNKMQLPPERLTAAVWAFHFSVFSFIIGLFKTCYDALIISHEKMAFYAYLGIAEVMLKLINAASLLYVGSVDKLILFSANQAIISLLILGCIVLFSSRGIHHIRPRFIWDKQLFRELFGFSGWSLFGSVASMSANQGLNILLNTFFGVVVNAAMGIANQVGAAVNQFVLNFQTAFRPQIVKSYAANDTEYLHGLIFKTCKFSYFLLFAIACPVVFNIDFLLNVWLGDSVPAYTAQFCALTLLYTLTETLSAPLWMTVQATGKIRTYQLVISSLIFLNIILSYCFLSLGFSPVVVLEIKCCLDLTYLVARLLFMRRMVHLSLRQFGREVLFPVMVVSALSLCVIYPVSEFVCWRNGWTELLATTGVFWGAMAVVMWLFGLTATEKGMMKKQILHICRMDC